jgi:hypothetical protein
VFVSRFQVAVLRVGDHPLAGEDPLSDCYEDPAICTDAYGNLAELDLGKDVRNGLDVGTSGGDQEMIVAEAGPAEDRRKAVRAARDDGSPGFQHQYLNFAILSESLGPSSQPPARLAICATYYDDPELVGKRFKPEVYITERNGVTTFGFTDDTYWVTLEGTDKWVDAYWEITDMKFNGVNQGPQAAARFTSEDKIFVTTIRYAVIRPCGPLAGVNLLESCKPVTDVQIGIRREGGNVVISWPSSAEGFFLEGTSSLSTPDWRDVNAVVELDPATQENFVTLPIESTTYFRLRK